MFRRYEPIFKRVLHVHDKGIDHVNKIIFKLAGSSITHRERIRDAYNSLIENRWLTDLNIEQLTSIWPQLVLHADKDKNECVIVPRRSRTKLVEPQYKDELQVNNPTEIEFRAMLVLQNYNTLFQTAFNITGLNSKLVQLIPTLQKEFLNVVFSFPNEDIPSHVVII